MSRPENTSIEKAPPDPTPTRGPNQLAASIRQAMGTEKMASVGRRGQVVRVVSYSARDVAVPTANAGDGLIAVKNQGRQQKNDIVVVCNAEQEQIGTAQLVRAGCSSGQARSLTQSLADRGPSNRRPSAPIPALIGGRNQSSNTTFLVPNSSNVAGGGQQNVVKRSQNVQELQPGQRRTGRGGTSKDAKMGPPENIFEKFDLKWVRFGTIRLTPLNPLEITTTHINLKVMNETDAEKDPRKNHLAFMIAYKHVESIQYHITSKMAVMFLKVSKYCAKKIRESMEISTTPEEAERDGSLAYFESQSQSTSRQYIILMLNEDTISPLLIRKQRLERLFATFVEPARCLAQVAEEQKKTAGSTPTAVRLKPLLQYITKASADNLLLSTCETSKNTTIPPNRKRNRSSVYEQQQAYVRIPGTGRDGAASLFRQYPARVIARQDVATVSTGSDSTVQIHAGQGSKVIVYQQQPQLNRSQVVPIALNRCTSEGNLDHHYGNIYYQELDAPNIAIPIRLVTTRHQQANSGLRLAAPHMLIDNRKRMMQQQNVPRNLNQTINLIDDDDDVEDDKTAKCPKTEVLFYYPECSDKAAIPIYVNDLECLQEEQFLNDAIIDFYLKFLCHQRLEMELSERVHVFNCFFYKKLTSRTHNSQMGGGLTHPNMELAKNKLILNDKFKHMTNWTKSVDIFDKDYVIVPVNEDSHWFLVVIYHPMSAVRKHMDKAMTSDGSNQQCAWIMVLDSLRDAVPNRYGTIRLLKEYLAFEWSNKKKDKTVGYLDEKLLRGLNPKSIPQQDNYWDCGIFVLEYAERFLLDPPKPPPNQTAVSWDFRSWNCSDFLNAVHNKRDYLKELIRKLSGERWSLVPDQVLLNTEHTTGNPEEEDNLADAEQQPSTSKKYDSTINVVKTAVNEAAAESVDESKAEFDEFIIDTGNGCKEVRSSMDQHQSKIQLIIAPNLEEESAESDEPDS